MSLKSARYVGPVGQLRGKSCLVASRFQFAGFAFCQFDDHTLVVAGEAMGYGWHPIKLSYLRAEEA